MKGIIYKWTCKVNGKSYIGQTINEKKREKSFLKINEDYGGRKIDNARRKYDVTKNNWEKTVLKRLWCKDGKEDELIDRLNKWEDYYIKLYDTIKNGYNTVDGGNLYSKETLLYMRKRGKEYWDNLSKEEKAQRNKKSIEKYTEWYNSLSDDEKMKFLKSSLGCHRGHSLTTTSNNSNGMVGIKRSEDVKEKIRRGVKESILKKKNSEEKEDGDKDRCGCYWIERLKRWRSTIYYKGNKKLLGHFEKIEAAIEIKRIAKEKKDNGKFEEWYKNIHEHKIKIYEMFGEITHR